VFLYSAGIIMLAVVSYIAFKSWRTYQDAKSRQVKIDWAVRQLERALEQTRTQSESDIIAGVQCLSTLSLPEIRATVLKRLTELTESDNTTIAKHAEWAIVRLSKSSRSRASN
jgi:hypothetical protein